MKATYFYSEKQRLFMEGKNARNPQVNFQINFAPNGKEFTYVATLEGVHSNRWDDSKIVQVIDNLPVNEFMLKHTGKRFAKTP